MVGNNARPILPIEPKAEIWCSLTLNLTHFYSLHLSLTNDPEAQIGFGKANNPLEKGLEIIATLLHYVKSERLREY